MTPALLLMLGAGLVGVMAIPAMRTVTDSLYRVAPLFGVLPMLVGVVWVMATGTVSTSNPTVHGVQVILVLGTAALAITALVFFHKRAETAARLLAAGTFAVGLLATSHVLHDRMVAFGTGLRPEPKSLAMGLQTLVCLLTMLLVGLVPVTLTAVASGWTKALGRLMPALEIVLAARTLLTFGTLAALELTGRRQVVLDEPVLLALRILTLVGLSVVIALAHRVRSRQQPLRATRLLLVAWVLTLLGETVGLLLLRNTSMPL